MRRFIISSLIVIAAFSSASASDRYPTKKRYVNQTGEIVTIGAEPSLTAYAEVPVLRSLPQVQIVPIIETPAIKTPLRRVAAAQMQPRQGLFGAINTDPANWPSGRTCCRPGEAYFNENPDS